MCRTEGRTRWLRGLVLLGCVAIGPLSATEPEDELKSATVLTFVRHAEWRGGATGPINIAVLGRPAMIRTFRRTLDGKTANSRAIHITDATLPTDLGACDVLYIASDNNKEVVRALAAARGSRALTIGESSRFLEYGGAVNLLIVDGHMSFEVSREALDRAGVAISSTLLRYGQIAPATPSRSARPPV